VPFMVENGQAVCKLTFERMLEEPMTLYGSDDRFVLPTTRRDVEPIFQAHHG